MFSDQERRKLQHEIKVYMLQYFKRTLGRGVDDIKIFIFEDMLVMRLTGFLTEPEKFIANTPDGNNIIKTARMHAGDQQANDITLYFEEKLKAKVICQTFNMDSEHDFAGHLVVFDRML